MEQMYFCNTFVDHLLLSYGPTVDHEPQSQNSCNEKLGYWGKHRVAAVTAVLKERMLQGLPARLQRQAKLAEFVL